jgi:copper homeostasis protein
LIAAVIDQMNLPVVVMIRPRSGGFVYSDDEIGAMTRDIELAGEEGIAGIVTGVLTADGHIDIERTGTLVNAAAGLPVTFHRAFDSTRNLPDALEQLIQIGVSRVLTSGRGATALEGAATIAALVDQARAWISIIAGGGIRENNVRDVVARTGAREVHSRLVDEASMKALIDVLKSDKSVSS